MAGSQSITVKLSPDAVEQVSGQAPADAHAQAVIDLVGEHGATLAQIDPRASDPSLRTFFRVDAPDAEAAEVLSEALNGLAAVEGAYIKPADEAP